MFNLGQAGQAGKDSPTCKCQLMNQPHIFQAHVDPSVTSINYFPFFPLINNFMLSTEVAFLPIPAMSSSKGPRFVNLHNLSSLSVYQLHCACQCHGPLTYHIQSINGVSFTSQSSSQSHTTDHAVQTRYACEIHDAFNADALFSLSQN